MTRRLAAAMVATDAIALLLATVMLAMWGDGFSFTLGVIVALFVPALGRDIARLRRTRV